MHTFCITYTFKPTNRQYELYYNGCKDIEAATSRFYRQYGGDGICVIDSISFVR